MIDRLKNSLIRRGKKKKAYRVYQKMQIRLRKELNIENGIEQVFDLLQPKLRLVNRKRGGSTYKLPTMITDSQAKSLALKWFLKSVKERKEKKLEDRLFGEVKEVLEGKGKSLKKKEDYYKLAVHNRGFIRFLKRRR